MKGGLERSRLAVMIGFLACSAAFTVTAEEPGLTAPTVSQATPDPRTLDREGKPIYGFELMSETEVSGFRSLLFSIKDPAAREEARAAHRKAMDKRAAERGVTIKQ
jgi:hypothetical protein